MDYSANYSAWDSIAVALQNPGLWIVAILGIVIMWKVFEKAGEKGWKAIIPIYSQYIFFKITWGNGWYFLLTLIPMANFVILIITCVKLAKVFGKGGLFAVGLIFLSLIFMAILAFGSAEYQGIPDSYSRS